MYLYLSHFSSSIVRDRKQVDNGRSVSALIGRGLALAPRALLENRFKRPDVTWGTFRLFIHEDKHTNPTRVSHSPVVMFFASSFSSSAHILTPSHSRHSVRVHAGGVCRTFPRASLFIVPSTLRRSHYLSAGTPR